MRAINLIVCFILLSSALRAQIIITELNPTPAAGEPEWVECVNISDSPLSLYGWYICDNRTCVRIGTVTLEAGGFLVLTRDAIALRESRALSPKAVIVEVALPSLNNSTDRVELRRADSVVIDSVAYDMRRFTRGRTIERSGLHRNGLTTYTTALNTCNSADSATCGYINTSVLFSHDLRLSGISSSDDALVIEIVNHGYEVTNARSATFRSGNYEATSFIPKLLPGEWHVWKIPLSEFHSGQTLMQTLVTAYLQGDDERAQNDTLRVGQILPPRVGMIAINEIMADPLPRLSDYVEIWNGTTDTIELEGWVIEDESGTRGVVTGRLRAAPNGYCVVAADTSIKRFVEAGLWALMRPAVNVNSTKDRLVLRTPSGYLTDIATYDVKRHHPFNPVTKGVSIEKRAPMLVGDDASAWSSSGDLSGGTPGRVNSINRDLPKVQALSASPSPFSSDRTNPLHPTIIVWKLPYLQAVARITVHQTNGMLVATLLNGAFIGSEGGVPWAGTDNAGLRVERGPYVVSIECVDAGSSAVFRDRCLVVVGE